MAERIGIAGTGRMGTAMGKRLIEVGHTVTAWNRTPARTAELAGAGAGVAESAAALAANADVVITAMTDHAALKAVLEGPDGLLAGAARGLLLIEMSTLLPPEQEDLAAVAGARGVHYVECPVGGTVAPALKGQLLGLAGGTAEDFACAEPILKALCKRVDHLGPVGRGAAMKLAVNLPLAVYWCTLGEALALLPEDAFDPAQTASILADSSGGPNVLRNRMELVAKTIAGEDLGGTFDLDGLLKDLNLALRWAAQRGKAMPITTAAAEAYAGAIAEGLGTLDGARVARFVRERAL